MITIEDIKAVVREASKLMLTDTFETEQKDGYANIVTSSDRAVQNFLCEQFAKLLPGSGFLCEEDDMTDLSHEYIWIIDPIDGTANYSRNIREHAICVGLRDKEGMLMGVVYLPRTGEMFHAERGKGAFLNDKPIHVSNRPYADAVLCTALCVYHKENTDFCSRVIVRAFKEINDIRRFGACAPELCYVAMGRCEMYFECILSPWDYAAASLILEEAGGFVAQLDGQHPSCLKPVGLIAANSRESLNRLLKIVKEETGNG